jgi:tetratricopeptide (TPR) repeat protein
MGTSSKEHPELSEAKAVQKNISTLYKQGTFQECIQECNKAIKQGHKNAGICNTKAIAHMQLGEHEQSLQAIADAIRLAPDNAHYITNKNIITAKIEAKKQEDEQQNTAAHAFVVKSEFDPSEEIRSYKSLLDNGIIDQGYFEMKKQELQSKR